jgi:hypothetical protein
MSSLPNAVPNGLEHFDIGSVLQSAGPLGFDQVLDRGRGNPYAFDVEDLDP